MQITVKGPSIKGVHDKGEGHHQKTSTGDLLFQKNVRPAAKESKIVQNKVILYG